MSYERIPDDDIRALGYEPTRKGWVSNRLSGQLNGQLSLLEAKRWSPATVVAYLRLPPSMARTYAVAMALGNGISREGSRASFRGGKDQVASVISGTKRKRICGILRMETHSFSNFARDCEKRYHVGHRCEYGVLCLWVEPLMEVCPNCHREVRLESPQSEASEVLNQRPSPPQSEAFSVPIHGDAMRDGKGDAGA